MEFTTLRIRHSPRILTVAIHRPEQQNAINGTLLRELNLALDLAESDPSCRFLVLEGQPGVFCTGMDFSEVANHAGPTDEEKAKAFMQLLHRMSLTPKVVIANVDGRVMAGGVGLAAASDFAISTERSQFSLSEALWGLLPACVIPFLIRRVGFQKAYTMTLSTLPISASQALACSLIDELTSDPADSIRRLLLRIGRLEENTIVSLKAYFRKMWIITEQTECEAVAEITRLVSDQTVRASIEAFVKDRKLPWSTQ